MIRRPGMGKGEMCPKCYDDGKAAGSPMQEICESCDLWICKRCKGGIGTTCTCEADGVVEMIPLPASQYAIRMTVADLVLLNVIKPALVREVEVIDETVGPRPTFDPIRLGDVLVEGHETDRFLCIDGEVVITYLEEGACEIRRSQTAGGSR